MRKEQYRALSDTERRAYLDSKKEAMADYYLRVLRPRRILEQLERKAKALAREPSKAQKLAKIRERMLEIRAKMEKS